MRVQIADYEDVKAFKRAALKRKAEEIDRQIGMEILEASRKKKQAHCGKCGEEIKWDDEALCGVCI